MTMKRIRLELARDKEHPSGDSEHGYEFAAPLTDDGHLDASEWRKEKERCRVKRFAPGEQSQLGLLMHGPGGSWYFDYDKSRTSDDEPGFKFSTHTFNPGDYVSVREHDGVLRTFRVARVSDLD